MTKTYLINKEQLEGIMNDTALHVLSMIIFQCLEEAEILQIDGKISLNITNESDRAKLQTFGRLVLDLYHSLINQESTLDLDAQVILEEDLIEFSKTK